MHNNLNSVVLISGLVTFLAAYHYIRVFNSWVNAYGDTASKLENDATKILAPTFTSVPFNDAYQYMDWLLTVPAGKLGDGIMEIQAPTFTDVSFTDAYQYMDWMLTVPVLLIEI